MIKYRYVGQKLTLQMTLACGTRTIFTGLPPATVVNDDAISKTLLVSLPSPQAPMVRMGKWTSILAAANVFSLVARDAKLMYASIPEEEREVVAASLLVVVVVEDADDDGSMRLLLLLLCSGDEDDSPTVMALSCTKRVH